jgi:GNAT superfamily N-acetyltransferase
VDVDPGQAPATEVTIRVLGRHGDLGWVVMAHGEVYAAEFGWDASFEALVARIVADYAATRQPANEEAWVAELGGGRVGCVFCVRRDDATAQLRLLLVAPAARGLGLGTRLVDRCVRFARDAGYRQLVLWTDDHLVAARCIYLAAGFRLVDAEPHHSFGMDLVGQTYALDLTAARPAAEEPDAPPRAAGSD